MTHSVETITAGDEKAEVVPIGQQGDPALAVAAHWLSDYRSGSPRRSMADHIGVPFDPDSGAPRDIHRLRAGCTFFAYCARRDLPVLKTEHRHVAMWLDELGRSGLSDTTRGQMLSAVSSFFSHAITHGFVSAGCSPTARIDRKKLALSTRTTTSNTRSLSLDEVRGLQRAADADSGRGADPARSGLLVSLLADMGLRVAELVELTADSVRYDQGKRVLTVMGKGRRARSLSIPAAVVERLDAYQQKQASSALVEHGQVLGDQPLITTASGKPFTRSGITQLLAKLARRADIPDPSTVTPHVLRHTWASVAREAGVAESSIQETLGHATVETTRRYGTTANGASARALESVANLVG